MTMVNKQIALYNFHHWITGTCWQGDTNFDKRQATHIQLLNCPCQTHLPNQLLCIHVHLIALLKLKKLGQWMIHETPDFMFRNFDMKRISRFHQDTQKPLDAPSQDVKSFTPSLTEIWTELIKTSNVLKLFTSLQTVPCIIKLMWNAMKKDHLNTSVKWLLWLERTSCL